jgi:hypothetical protein
MEHHLKRMLDGKIMTLGLQLLSPDGIFQMAPMTHIVAIGSPEWQLRESHSLKMGAPAMFKISTERSNVKRYLINYPHLSDYGQTIFCLSFPSRDRATAPGQYEQFYFTEHVPYPQK